MRRILVAESMTPETSEQVSVRWLVERLDAWTTVSGNISAVVNDIMPLLERASSSEVELLLEMMLDRKRVAKVFDKYIQGTISRTGYLSFVAEQRWPAHLRRRMRIMGIQAVSETRSALVKRDIALLRRAVLASHGDTGDMGRP
jgi:hypothetical protein